MWNRNIPRQGNDKHQKSILLLCGVSIAFYLLPRLLPLGESDREQMRHASEMMAEALVTLRQCRSERGIPVNERDDRNRTGLIGLEFSPLTTSRGSLEAKRTTTNPNFAALIVHLLKEAKVDEMDTIAVGASASFPALIVATLSAAKALKVKALPIYSVGASQWGANEVDFNWLHMESCLRDSGWLDIEPVAISLGGENDIGKDWSPELRSSLESMIIQRGAHFLQAPEIRSNVAIRMKLYESRAANEPIRAFVHIGGAWANMGESPDVLELEPGLVEIQRLPPQAERGMIFEMADRGIPILHLLYIKGLAERYGLPWDPRPLPSPGEGNVYHLARQRDPLFFVLAAAYLVLVAGILIFKDRFVGRSG